MQTDDKLRDIHRRLREVRLRLLQIIVSPQFELEAAMSALDELNAVESDAADLASAAPSLIEVAVSTGVSTALSTVDGQFSAVASSLSSTMSGLRSSLTGSNSSSTSVSTSLAPNQLSVDPTTASFAVGVPSSVALTISGGSAPYTADNLPTGVAFDGANLNADETTTDGTNVLTISDSSSPPLTNQVTVSIG
jgi:hypothetical protein